MTPIDVYVNFVLHAIYGRLGEADFLMKNYGQGIRQTADLLSRMHPIDPKPLYRGLLLDPALGLGEHFPFVSWSEDRDVAAWFADRNSFISEPFRMFTPEARGYMLKLERHSSRVLFHYNWREAFGMPLEQLALRHPSMGLEGHRQIAWSLDHQREVIIEPIEKLSICPYEASAEETERLDRKLKPKWLETEAA